MDFIMKYSTTHQNTLYCLKIFMKPLFIEVTGSENIHFTINANAIAEMHPCTLDGVTGLNIFLTNGRNHEVRMTVEDVQKAVYSAIMEDMRHGY